MKSHVIAKILLSKPEIEISDFVAGKLLNPSPAKAASTGLCWCGCGGSTKSRFVPGHDARFHGLAKKVARGTAPKDFDAEAYLETLPCDAAREDFLAHVEAELTVIRLKSGVSPFPAKVGGPTEPVKEPVVTDEFTGEPVVNQPAGELIPADGTPVTEPVGETVGTAS